MNVERTLLIEEIADKVKTSPYWRDDFRITEAKHVGGIVVYYVESDRQDSETVLAITRLNEMLGLQ